MRFAKPAALIAAAASMAIMSAATPALAADTVVTKDGCTVNSVRPVKVSGSVHYSMTIKCNANRLVSINILGREHDVDTPHDTVASTTTRVQVTRGVARTVRLVKACANTERGFEELFAQARMAIADSTPTWSQWDRSAINGAIC